jgi:hypothetical protein
MKPILKRQRKNSLADIMGNLDKETREPKKRNRGWGF